MPFWSIAEWRARIGSSWCALGRPIKTRSPYRHCGGRLLTMLTRTNAAAMIIMLMVFIGINLGLRTLLNNGYHLPLKGVVDLYRDSLLQKLYLINCCVVLPLIFPVIKTATPVVYQSLPSPVQSMVKEFLGGIRWYLLLGCSIVIRWLIVPVLPIVTFLLVDVLVSLMLTFVDLLPYISCGVSVIQWFFQRVSHITDWLGAFSNLLKTLTIRRVTSSSKHKRTILTMVKDWSRYLVAIMMALLETTSSVAASVILTRLLMSGDVERNPGPGRYPDLDYDCVDADQILDEDDVTDVHEEVLILKSVYFPLGLCLRLANDDLKAVREAYPDDSVADQALREVLLLWLRQKYRVDKYGPPTWRMLTEAVDKKTGGDNHELAKQIASSHLAVPVSMKELLDIAWEYRARWRLIGIELQIDASTLEAIAADNHHKVGDCLTELIKIWLRQIDPRLARRYMTKAVKSERLTGSESPINKAEDTKSGTTEEHYSLYLKSLYKANSHQPLADSDQWPPSATKKVFHLAMIKTEELRMKTTSDEFLRQKTIVGKVDDVLEKGVVKVELKDVFQGTDSEPNKLVLIDGAPGSGKSTLSLQMCLLWSEDKLFQEYKLVILVRLRDPVVQDAKSVADLLPYRDEVMAQEVGSLIKVNDGDGVLFVLDGWDELPKSAPGHSVILSLMDRTHLHKTQLPKSTVVVTSRPTSSANLHKLVTSRIEILGFTQSELQRFFTECLQNNSTKVEKLLHKIKENPAVEGSCYLPMNASIIVHLFKCEESLHFASQYSIFSALVRNCIIRHVNKNGLQDQVPALESLDNLPQLINGPFKYLCELAYKGIIDDKVTFDITLNSSFNTLGLLQGVESFAGCGISRSYNFIHLSLQEILAAIHVATHLTEKKQTSEFKKLLGNARFNAVFGFYAAKTELKIPGIRDVVMKIVGNCTVEEPKAEHKAQLLSLLHCLFEAQDPSLCQLVVNERVKHSLSFENFVRFFKRTLPDHISELDLFGTSLNPFDCVSIGFFLSSIESDLDVNLHSCSIGPEGCKALFRADGHVYHIRKLILYRNGIGAEGASVLSEALKTMVNLRVLNLGYNDIGTEGARVLIEALRTMKNIQVLNLNDNGIGAEGASVLSEALKTMVNLQVLDLGDNSIEDEGAVAVSEAMKGMSNLQTLSLGSNSIKDEGAIAVSEAMKKMTNLQMLVLDGNYIKDEGAVAVSEAMKGMSNLQTLSLDRNSIKDEGAIAVSEAMKKMTNLETLFIMFNDIGDAGKTALRAAAKKSGTKLFLYI